MEPAPSLGVVGGDVVDPHGGKPLRGGDAEGDHHRALAPVRRDENLKDALFNIGMSYKY
jgi:hypothetical protein